MNNLIIRCIKNFPIYIFFHIENFNSSWFSSFFTIDISFHIKKIIKKKSWPITCLGIFIRCSINIYDQNHKKKL